MEIESTRELISKMLKVQPSDVDDSFLNLMDEKAGLLAAVPIVGSTIPIAVGYAWMNKLKNIKNKTVVFFGEGATETGVFHESIGYAALHQIPIIFVCENNLYSVYTHLKDRQSKWLLNPYCKIWEN